MPQTITNIPRCLPQILTVPEFWCHLAHLFSCKNVPFDFERAFWEAEGALSKPKGPFSRENEAQEMTPKLLALAKVCSVLGNIRDVSWHLSKRGNELEKRWTFCILGKNGAHKNKACFTDCLHESKSAKHMYFRGTAQGQELDNPENEWPAREFSPWKGVSGAVEKPALSPAQRHTHFTLGR